MGTTKVTRRVSLKDLFWFFFISGWTAFGFTILQKMRTGLVGKGWATEEEMDAGISLIQLYPGPTNFNFVAYSSYLLYGIPGMFIGLISFITPSFWFMVLLSWLYFSVGNLPWVPVLLVGLSSVSVGVLASLIMDLAERALRGWVAILILLAAITLHVAQVQPFLIILGGFLLGTLLLRDDHKNESSSPLPEIPREHHAWLWIAAFSLPLVTMILVTILVPGVVSSMVLSFLKTGSVAFGSGAVIIPLLKSDVVDHFRWLSEVEFIDGVVLGQMTPGPFFITSAFIGFKLGGVLGSVIGTLAICYPAFLYTMIAVQLYRVMQASRILAGGLKGVLPVFIAMLGMVTVQIAFSSMISLPAVLLTLAAFLFNRYLKTDVVWIFGGGLLIWGALMIFGLV